jgi:tRNA/tmRNA/rRNA uracil-C5-methylase (TrmA/RlmC/RlmD family)
MLAVGATVRVEVERPAVGGAMLARHEGEVLFVEGAIPGEVVSVRVHARTRSVAQARVVDVHYASPDRVTALDPACGGRDYAHIGRARQRALKREQVVDVLRRIAKLPASTVHDTVGDDRPGCRVRARLHWDGQVIGFLRSGSHVACVDGVSEQFSAPLLRDLERLSSILASSGLPPMAFDVSENVAATERGFRVTLPRRQADDFVARVGEAFDQVAMVTESQGCAVILGQPLIVDAWEALGVEVSAARPVSVGLQRQPHAFFQGHRYLLPRLLAEVGDRVKAEHVVDLYAGVGLFGLMLAARGISHVACVEGDPVSGADLSANAAPFGEGVDVSHASVERWLAGRSLLPGTAVIIDPPRTGLSKEALEGLVRGGASCVVYVSCDPATFARDVGRLVLHGYELGEVRPVDLFPDTGHVEVVAALQRTLHA